HILHSVGQQLGHFRKQGALNTLGVGGVFRQFVVLQHEVHITVHHVLHEIGIVAARPRPVTRVLVPRNFMLPVVVIGVVGNLLQGIVVRVVEVHEVPRDNTGGS